MSFRIRGAIALVLLLVLASCATIPEVPFDRATNPIATIGLLDPGIPPKANVILTGTVGQSMAASAGAIGALVGGIADESMRAARVRHFEEAVTARGYVAHDNLVADLTTALQARGYAVTSVPVKRLEPQWLKTYPPKGETSIDAYLDIVVSDYGYLAAGIGDQPYRPFVSALVKFVRASDGKVLMQDQVQYNPLGQPKNVVTIAPDPAYAFIDADALRAAPDQSLKGLDQALMQTADTIGNLLR